MICDGTILYNQIISGYTYAIGAFCIFYIFAVVFRNIKLIKLIVGFANCIFRSMREYTQILVMKYIYGIYMFTIGLLSCLG